VQTITHPAMKMIVFCSIFLLKQDISKLLNELGHVHEKIQFYEVLLQFFHVTIVQFFTCVPKYLSITQFLPNPCLTFPAGQAINKLDNCKKIWTQMF